MTYSICRFKNHLLIFALTLSTMLFMATRGRADEPIFGDFDSFKTYILDPLVEQQLLTSRNVEKIKETWLRSKNIPLSKLKEELALYSTDTSANFRRAVLLYKSIVPSADAVLLRIAFKKFSEELYIPYSGKWTPKVLISGVVLLAAVEVLTFLFASWDVSMMAASVIPLYLGGAWFFMKAKNKRNLQEKNGWIADRAAYFSSEESHLIPLLAENLPESVQPETLSGLKENVTLIMKSHVEKESLTVPASILCLSFVDPVMEPKTEIVAQ